MVIGIIVYAILASAIIVNAIVACVGMSKVYKKMAKDESEFTHSICEAIIEYIGEKGE